MKRPFLVLGAAVLVLPWLSGSWARADMIQWSVAPITSTSDNIANIYPVNNVPQSWVTLGSWLPTTGTNSGSVQVAMVEAIDDSNSFQNAHIGGSTGNYSLSFKLTDLASGTSGSLTFSGNLSGYFNNQNLQLNNTFIGPTTESLTLGGNLYTVTIGPFVPPGPPNSEEGVSLPQGSISASISVQPATSATPEPSSLLLACLAVPPLGLARWLRRRKTVANHA